MAAHANQLDFILNTVAAPHNLDNFLALLKRDGTMTLVGVPAEPHPSPSVQITLLPWDAPLLKHMETADGLFLSNGPGDPVMLGTTITHIKEVMSGMSDGSLKMKPIFGICLGNQLLSIAAGAKTRKLPFGNRGQNQPVTNLATGECYITPQNHGYEVVEEGLPAGWKPLFRNANDGSNEGIQHEVRLLSEGVL